MNPIEAKEEIIFLTKTESIEYNFVLTKVPMLKVPKATVAINVDPRVAHCYVVFCFSAI